MNENEEIERTKHANVGYSVGLGVTDPGAFIEYAKNFKVEMNEIELEKSKELKAMWLEQRPEMDRYFAYINE